MPPGTAHCQPCRQARLAYTHSTHQRQGEAPCGSDSGRGAAAADDLARAAVRCACCAGSGGGGGGGGGGALSMLRGLALTMLNFSPSTGTKQC